MLRKETHTERFTFGCEGCGHVWSTSYDVLQVEDGHGHSSQYFYRNRIPSADPRGAHAVVCPQCGNSHVRADLVQLDSSPSRVGPRRRPTNRDVLGKWPW
jgi:hypothetical protein